MSDSCVKLTENHNRLFHTAAEISDYAEKVFGLSNFTPAETHLSYGESHLNTVREDMGPTYYNIDEMEKGDVYTSVPHGGILHAFRITEIEQMENSATILVQFYADVSQTVRSHLYQYQMERWATTGPIPPVPESGKRGSGRFIRTCDNYLVFYSK